MDPASIDIPEELEVPEEDTGTTRHGLHSCLHFFLSGVTMFFFGMMLGVPGGLLLGRVAVVVLRSLELLAEDKLLMDHLENYMNTIKDYDIYISEKMNMAPRSDNVHMFNVFISILAEEFGGLIGIFSSFIGLAVGSSMYKLMMKESDQSDRGKAFSVAGPLCLMVTSAVGCLLGLLLHMYLSITLTVIICFFFVQFAMGYFFIRMQYCGGCGILLSMLTICIFSPLNTPMVVCLMFLLTFVFQSKLNLSLALISKTSPMRTFAKSCGFDLIITPISPFLIITDVFNFARKPIVILQQANATSTSSAAVEGIFVGVLSTLFLMAAIGVSLFSFGEIKGEYKICAGAVTSGAAVMAVIEPAVPVLGAGPTIGALMGVAGTVGVTLAAARETVFRFGQEIDMFKIVGVLGVTAGAVVGAFLTSSTHSGLSALYLCLSTATIPITLFLAWMKMILKRGHAWPVIKICVYLLSGVLSAVWVYFTIPIQGVVTLIAYCIVSNAAGFVLYWISGVFDFWGLSFLRYQGKYESGPSSPEDQSSNQINQIIHFFSLHNMATGKLDIMENVYTEAGSKLVHLTQGLRQRLRSSGGNRASDSM